MGDVVVTEHTLSRCIYQLRNELRRIGSTAAGSDYDPVETLPKRGYKLIATVAEPELTEPVSCCNGASNM